MKPHSSLRKQLVNPKDKIDPLEKTDCIYEIPCKNCAHTYTGRKFTTRLKEHKKEADKLECKNKKFTRQARKQSVGEQSKSAIADHALQNNHVINWDDAKVLQMESDASARCCIYHPLVYLMYALNVCLCSEYKMAVFSM